MKQRWAGPLITAIIVGGVALIVLLNLNPSGMSSAPRSTPVSAPAKAVATTAGEGDAAAGECAATMARNGR